MTDYRGQYIQGEVEESGVLHLRMNRAPVNAADSHFFVEFGHYFALAKTDPDVKAIVLSSAFPKYFTAGLDLKEASSSLTAGPTDPARKAVVLRHHIISWQQAINQAEECDKPVIAAIAGIAYGLAIDISCACDIRYATEDATFSIREVEVGLAADMGTLSRLGKIIGNDSLARELAFTARPFKADEALKMGLISRVVSGGHAEVVEAALNLARVIASKSPIAVLGTKHLMNYSRDHSVAEGLLYTTIWNAAMVQTDDMKQAMLAVMKKKQPRFAKL